MMNGQILWRSFNRNWHKKLLLIATVAVGSSLTTSVLDLSLDLGNKLSRELKRYGANIVVQPVAATSAGGGAYLHEPDLGKLKAIFWGNNVLAFAPYLKTTVDVGTERDVPVAGTWFNQTIDLPTGEQFTTGVKAMKDWWHVAGSWPDGPAEALVGQDLAQRLRVQPGQTLTVTLPGNAVRTLEVTGVLDAGGQEDGWILAPLAAVQGWTGHVGHVERVEVSAMTTPESEMARQALHDPKSLSEQAYETWYCTAYASSIAYQIEEAIPGSRVRPLQEVSHAEGTIISRVQAVMTLLAVLGLVVAAIGISNLMQAKVRERQQELGLMRSLGASKAAILSLFVGEALVEGAIGGTMGYGLGVALAWFIGRVVFGIAIAPQLAVLPLVLLLSSVVTLGGSFSALGYLLRLQPARVLRGE